MAADCLYRLGKELALQVDRRRLGRSRQLALEWKESKTRWVDPYKQWQQDVMPLYELPKVTTLKRSLGTGRKKRIAHVIPQCVDGGHAPSRRLHILLKSYDQREHEVHLFLSEHLCLKRTEYPMTFYVSQSSKQRGQKILSDLFCQGVQVHAPKEGLGYECTASWLVEELKQQEIDRVFFHTDAPVHLFAARRCDVPMKYFIEHGSYTLDEAFDRYIFSFEEEAALLRKKYPQWKERFHANPVAIDSKKKWMREKPFSKAFLGIEEDEKILTTISNHLTNRMSAGMFQAIAGILQHCPNAYYIPIGPIFHSKKFKEIFHYYGVWERVILLGYQSHPSFCVATMDLYLNEFPFGGGLSCYDAITAGLPIVTMYEEKGPMQGRQGAYYLGIDKAVTSGNPQDYVDIACKLLTDHTMYHEWKEHTLAVHRQRGTECDYQARHQKIMLL